MNHFDEHHLSFVLRHYRQGMFDTQKAWEKVSGNIRPYRRPVWTLWALPVAAALVLGVFLFWRNSRTEYYSYDLAQSFTLKDGTRVTLAPGATLSYQPHKAPRQVEMTGKVLYEVVHDEKHPFNVSAPNAMITVLGTVFQVRSDGEDVSVDVTEGRVRFESSQGGSLILTTGQSASLHDGVPTLFEAPLPNPSAWARGIFQYEATPLETVLEELSAYYGIPIRIKGNPAGKALTGTFPTENLDEILDLIGLALDVEFVREGKEK